MYGGSTALRQVIRESRLEYPVRKWNSFLVNQQGQRIVLQPMLVDGRILNFRQRGVSKNTGTTCSFFRGRWNTVLTRLIASFINTSGNRLRGSDHAANRSCRVAVILSTILSP